MKKVKTTLSLSMIWIWALQIKSQLLPEIYGADGVEFAPTALKEINTLEELGFKNVPVCIAKTQYSLTDDPKMLGRPTGFKINVRNVKISAGAGFAVALTGAIITMPGLPKRPAAEKIDVDVSGEITGLF